LLMKKGEPMMNFFTDLVTYLFRCNTDVTSLLSGTAIKAVVAYISDYISKPSLRTYIVFDTIKSVFDKNTELITGGLERSEKGRKIMTQIVNSLTSKMEIGAPMASLYLLGNPDHYTSHSFVPFYWKSFVYEARHCFIKEYTDGKDEGNLVLKRVADSVVGTSPVFDYIYRPLAFDGMCLYDWIRLSEKKRIPREKSTVAPEGCPQRSSSKFSDYHKFTEDHPLHSTHHVRVLTKGEGNIPNFVGGSLPRHDKGDLEYYASTMLALFAPWRSGADLKEEDMPWSQRFHDFHFSDRHSEIMKFFNVRYECLDARDDYAAQMREDSTKLDTVDWANDKFPYDADDDDDWGDKDTVFPRTDENHISNDNVVGKLTSKWNYDKAVIEQNLRSSGWLSPSLSPVELDNTKSLVVEKGIKPCHWKSRVKDKRDEVLEKRNSCMTQHPSQHNTTVSKMAVNSNPNEVRIVDHTYLKKSFQPHSVNDCLLINGTVDRFSLNNEQARAFRIVANHAT
ncbi:hypothetical protein BJ138DRAFT_972909, partial [Hygrophoropsis aurantiaca]